MADKKKIDLSAMTTEEKQKLLQALNQDKAVGGVDTGYVYTNATNAEYMIPDLGFGKDRSFVPITFTPYEVKDLMDFFPAEKIAESHYLRKAVADGQLLKGRHDRASLEAKGYIDPLAIKCQENPTGTFNDPLGGQTPGEPGQRYFDKKLEELRARDEKEDQATRKR